MDNSSNDNTGNNNYNGTTTKQNEISITFTHREATTYRWTARPPPGVGHKKGRGQTVKTGREAPETGRKKMEITSEHCLMIFFNMFQKFTFIKRILFMLIF